MRAVLGAPERRQYGPRHYALALDYTRTGNRLAGSATATQALDRFDLDLRGFAISRLEVNGQPAAFTRDGQELQITPRGRLAAGRARSTTAAA